VGIDFQNNKKIVTLSSNDFNVLYPIFNILNNKTGIMIDEYSDALLSPNHTKILLDLITNNVDKKSLSDNLLQLLNLFEKAIESNTWIKIIGE